MTTPTVDSDKYQVVETMRYELRDTRGSLLGNVKRHELAGCWECELGPGGDDDAIWGCYDTAQAAIDALVSVCEGGKIPRGEG